MPRANKTATKKKTATKAQRQPPLTDPRLAALLLYITNDSPDSEEEGRLAAKYARTQQAARALLGSQPITSAFTLGADRPDHYNLIVDLVRAHFVTWNDPENALRALDAIEDAWHERSDDPVAPNDVRDVVYPVLDASMLFGATLMYELLTGGAR